MLNSLGGLLPFIDTSLTVIDRHRVRLSPETLSRMSVTRLGERCQA